jgi:zinc/manganese transport system permease protein
VALAAALGAGGAVLGLLLSAVFDLPSGPSVVLVQALGFLLVLLLGAGRNALAG